MGITIIIVVITCIVSFLAFSNQRLTNDFIFDPPAIANQNQWYRFFSCGLIHADMGHLAFNMISLYMFGRLVESSFSEIFGGKGVVLYVILYISSLAISLVPTYMQQKDNYRYRSLGASGAVSAVVFVGILLFPDFHIGFLFIPPVIPGFIFGPLYLIITAYLAKKGGGGINHSAHLWGALYGLAFIIVMSFTLGDFNPISNFFDRISSSF